MEGGESIMEGGGDSSANITRMLSELSVNNNEAVAKPTKPTDSLLKFTLDFFRYSEKKYTPLSLDDGLKDAHKKWKRAVLLGEWTDDDCHSIDRSDFIKELAALFQHPEDNNELAALIQLAQDEYGLAALFQHPEDNNELAALLAQDEDDEDDYGLAALFHDPEDIESAYELLALTPFLTFLDFRMFMLKTLQVPEIPDMDALCEEWNNTAAGVNAYRNTSSTRIAEFERIFRMELSRWLDEPVVLEMPYSLPLNLKESEALAYTAFIQYLEKSVLLNLENGNLPTKVFVRYLVENWEALPPNEKLILEEEANEKIDIYERRVVDYLRRKTAAAVFGVKMIDNLINTGLFLS